jgi:hypothetical protein
VNADDVLAAQLREATFQLYNDMHDAIVDGDDVSCEIVESWQRRIKAVNQSIGRYARTNVDRITRLQVELGLQQATASDELLDRESTHCVTLAKIAEANADLGVQGVLRAIEKINTESDLLASELELFYTDAEICDDVTSADPETHAMVEEEKGTGAPQN